MAEEIIIGKLVVESAGLDQAMLASKAAILEVEKKQKDLKAATDNLNGANEQQLETFIKNETELKKLKSEYAANQKSVLELQKANLGLDAALSQQNKTQAEATENSKRLLEARRNIDATTVEGAKVIADINEKLEQNKKFILENSSAQEKAANISGNYRQKIFDLNGGLSDFIDKAQDAGGAGKLVKDGLGQMASGFVNGAKAALAFILTPVGAFIAGLVLVFTAIKTAMDRSAESTAKISKLFAIFSGITNILLKAVAVLGDYFINKYVKAVEVVGNVTDAAFKKISKALFFLGFKKAASDLNNFTNSTKAATKASQDLAFTEAELKKEQRKARLTQLVYQKDAEKFRQLRDDETKTISERINANEKLGETLKNQLKEELAIAKLSLKFANDKLKQDGQRSELLDKQADALTQIADIEGRITGQESEQKVNRVSLIKEAADKQKEYAEQRKAQAEKNRAAELKESQNKIDILKTEANQRNLNAAQQLKLANDVFEAENALAKKSFSGSDLTKAYLENRQNLSSSILSITENEINKEQEAQQARLEKTQIVNSQVFESEKQRAIDLANAQTLLLDKKLLTEKDYAAEIVLIEKNKQENIALITAGYEEQKKLADEKAIADKLLFEDLQFQLKLQNIEGRNATEQEIKQALLDAEYANDLALLQKSLDDKLITEENYELKKQLVQKKYNAATIANDKIVNAIKRRETERTVQNGLNAAGALFEGSKAIAVASALFNTYQGITAELSTKARTPYEIGLKVANVAFVAAAGFAAVKNILKTNKNSSGDASGGGATRPQTTSGTGSFVNSAKTETVARVSEKPVEQNTVVSPPVLVLETLQEVANNQQVKIQSS